LFENFKQKPGISSIIKNKRLILIWGIALISIVLISWVFVNQDFSQMMVIPKNSVVPTDTNFETKGFECELDSVWIEFILYSEDGIHYKGNNYNIEIYINNVLEYTNVTNIVAQVGDHIDFIATPKDLNYELIEHRFSAPCFSTYVLNIQEIKKQIPDVAIMITDYNI